MEDREDLVQVGEKIKRLREDKAMSLDDAAKRSGLSSSVLSQIENHMVSPSLGVLVKLAKALEVKVGHFLDEDESEEPYHICRGDERKVTSRFASTEGVSYGYSYESLGHGKKDRKMEPFIVTLTPAELPSVDLNQHTGEEFIYVLEGEVEVKLGEHTDVLKPGDSIYYNSHIPHLVSCHGDETARIVAVIYAHDDPMIF